MSESKELNRCALIGTITEMEGTVGMIETVRKDEYKQGVEYRDYHEVDFGKRGFKKGEKVKVLGSLANLTGENEFGTIVKAQKALKVNKDTSDLNYVEVAGKTVGRFKYYPPLPDKKGFGNLRMIIAGHFVNAVLYTYQAKRLDESEYAKKGSVLGVAGRLQRREANVNGRDMIFTEVVVDENELQYIAKPEVVDHFADFEDEPDKKPSGSARTANAVI